MGDGRLSAQRAQGGSNPSLPARSSNPSSENHRKDQNHSKGCQTLPQREVEGFVEEVAARNRLTQDDCYEDPNADTAIEKQATDQSL